MLRNRLDGLVSLHGIWVTLLTTGSFHVFTLGTQLTGWMKLAPGFNFSLYLLATFIGLLVASRVYGGWADRLPRLGWRDVIYLTIQQVARLALVLFGVAFAMKDVNVSRVFLGSYLGVAGIVLLVLNRHLPRLLARVVFKSRSISTIVIGSPLQTPGLEGWLAEQQKLGVDLLGFVTKRNDPLGDDGRRIGFIDELRGILERDPVTQIILPLFYLDAAETKQVMATAREAGCRVRLVENLDGGLRRPLELEHTDAGIDVISDGDEPLENPVNRGIKRSFDIAVSLPVVLFVLPPLTLLVLLAQRFQAPGPVFFRQVRYGAGRKTFLIFKYRTMYLAGREGEATQATEGDSRVYPFGRFLRKTSLDEIPQFLNVLFGEMSVAGPRPHLVQHDDEFARFVSHYRMRHFVKPGITGLAQCKGFRGEITHVGLLFKRVENDIDYVRTWTPAMDLLILLRTIREVIFPPKSAY